MTALGFAGLVWQINALEPEAPTAPNEWYHPAALLWSQNEYQMAERRLIGWLAASRCVLNMKLKPSKFLQLLASLLACLLVTLARC